MTLLDRQRGCLLGLAVGDALGAAVEFQPPGTFEPVTGYRAGGPHRLEPGEWTDDTSLALALADSIAQAGWDLNDQVRRYVSWADSGVYSVNGECFDTHIILPRDVRVPMLTFLTDHSRSPCGHRSSPTRSPAPKNTAGWRIPALIC